MTKPFVIVAPLTAALPLPVIPVIVNVKLGSTVAETAIEVEVRIANAAELGPSIVAVPLSFEVILTKYVVSAPLGLVTPVSNGTITVLPEDWAPGVVTVNVKVQLVLPVPVQLPLVEDAEKPVPPIPATVPSVGEAERIMPDGAVHVPDAVVQYWKSTVLICVVDGVTKVNL